MTYRRNRRGIGEMLRAPFMQADMLRRAENAKAFAESIAPHDTGGFAEHMHASVVEHGGIRHDRAEGRLSNDDPGALSIETGTEDTPAHRTLQTALDAMR